ncbi:MAG: tRNA(Ile)-lysidine synthase [Frankiales bacterium]|nr:tRNA(Ile)-lysidine synthase [Frankiales bacterium]
MTGPAPAVAATRLAVRRCLRELSGTVVVAVSGGADSLALLSAVAFEAPKLGLRPVAVTVDHGLQGGSAEQAAAVVAQAATLGVAARVAVVAVTGPGGPEAAARTARYEALHSAAERVQASAILLGHTLDDQAETVLLGLARGSGARSLSGMPATAGLLRRPLLGVRRQQTLDACAALGLTPWQDPMNHDPAYARVRVRAQALPELEAAIGPGVAEALARTAEQLSQDADALDGWAAQALAAATDEVGGLSVEVLLPLPAAIRSRVLRAAAVRAGAPAGSLTAAHVRELDRLVTDWHGQGPVALPGPYGAVRDCGRLLLVIP